MKEGEKKRAVPKVIGTARWSHCDPSFCHPEPFDFAALHSGQAL